MRLEGKVAIIFGAGQLAGRTVGNGKAVALMFAREGAKVFCVDINKAGAQETVAAIREEGGVAEAFEADVTDEDTVVAAVRTCYELWGAIDILHNNVGVSIAAGDATITDITVDAFDRVMAINLRGMVLTIKHVLPIMRKQGSGSIINISSAAAFNNYPYVGYKTSKAAVVALSNHVAIRNAEYGVRCNVILPGLLNTPTAVENRVKKFGLSFEEVVAQRDKEVPLRRKMGTAWDIGYAAVFLASDEASFITGVSLPVDGGQSQQIGRAPSPAEAAEEKRAAEAAAATVA
ncbi:SDR family NAD(P)-dependent oxidoreductase [Actinacidiphila sp. ITFR-21]|uniref:SDR family NAD(P)-dependent oxidoreductase n=1 Tax=Actinacidiphila sp. ITFR-21 TaxID=3075199 RepID=UPI00288A48E2|nr:SDR family NAD(P)-dependent oxidoreductase [Streptomyces sp. ITFR-21]WNI16461.1 SDR family NAD(P)-dependent oxidoreductase [Streptomyces sp. ITFR-21]